MERRKCLNCNEPIPKDKRADSKFCNNSCKAWYWEKHKTSNVPDKPKLEETKTPISQTDKPEKGTPLEGLRGVINNGAESEIKQGSNLTTMPSSNYPSNPVSECPPTDMQKENPEYKKLLDKRAELETEIKREEVFILRSEQAIKKAEAMTNSGGGFQQPNRHFVSHSDMLQLRDIFLEEEGFKQEPPEGEKQSQLKEIQDSKAKCQQVLEHNKTTLKQLMEALEKIPRHLKSVSPFSKFLISKKKSEPDKMQAPPQTNMDTIEISPVSENESNAEEINNDTTADTPINDRIISSRELVKLDYKSLDFQGRWKEFLGQPSINFHFAVHGLPGGGKSTFCLQLADYLAKNFGNVIYVSGEEGYSKTLKDKVILTKADSKNLYFHDAKNLDDIKLHIPADRFHFVFIDSLDTLRIDALKLKELREYYSQSAFVTISQSRKDGKMKGDNEILHDADTIIGIQGGIAVTSKNRFNQSDRRFEVFVK